MHVFGDGQWCLNTGVIYVPCLTSERQSISPSTFIYEGHFNGLRTSDGQGLLSTFPLQFSWIPPGKSFLIEKEAREGWGREIILLLCPEDKFQENFLSTL